MTDKHPGDGTSWEVCWIAPNNSEQGILATTRVFDSPGAADDYIEQLLKRSPRPAQIKLTKVVRTVEWIEEDTSEVSNER